MIQSYVIKMEIIMNVIRNKKIIMLGLLLCITILNPMFCMIGIKKDHSVTGAATIGELRAAPMALDAREVKIPASIVADFDPLGINTRLRAVSIDGGVIQIRQNHHEYMKSDLFKIFAGKDKDTGKMIAKELKLVLITGDKEKIIGARTYHIVHNENGENTVSMGDIEIHEQYRRLGLAKLLIFAALADQDIIKHECKKATAVATNQASKNLLYKFGFFPVHRTDRTDETDEKFPQCLATHALPCLREDQITLNLKMVFLLLPMKIAHRKLL